MAQPLFCDNIGNVKNPLGCCFVGDQDSRICQRNFNRDVAPFSGGCPSGDCLKDCSDVTTIYQSLAQNDPAGPGNGQGPIRRYQTCANVPNVASYVSQRVLGDNITTYIGKNVSTDATPEQLKSVTSAVTSCLTATCGNARNQVDCKDKCEAVNLLINNTTPNVQGINDCLDALCLHEFHALPFADADIVGIGVFSSYIAQCMLVVILWFGLLAFDLRKSQRKGSERLASIAKPVQQDETQPERNSSAEQPHPKPDTLKTEKPPPTYRRLFQDLIKEFHVTQCYFSATLQIASLSYDILSTTNFLNIFMLTPLATNGVLPVVFTYCLLLYWHGDADLGTALLTTVCWLLSSIVYWILYSSVIPINRDIDDENRRYRAYKQFMYKLSALDECGGYSALAVCPTTSVRVGQPELSSASHKLRALTPIIWAFATLCLVCTLGMQYAGWRRRSRESEKKDTEVGETRAEKGDTQRSRPRFFPSEKMSRVIYWLSTACFLAGIGMQLSLLSIGTSLNMMDRKDWGFGQIIAVTIWVPPLVNWIYRALEKVSGRKEKRG